MGHFPRLIFSLSVAFLGLVFCVAIGLDYVRRPKEIRQKMAARDPGDEKHLALLSRLARRTKEKMDYS